MDKLFEKSIKNEKIKLKTLLTKLKVSQKNSKKYNYYYKRKNIIVDSLHKQGIKSIIWDGKKYNLLDDINRRNQDNFANTDVVKKSTSVINFNQFADQDTETNILSKGLIKSGEPGVQPKEKATLKLSPHKKYKMNDIVTITTQAHNIDAVYMGLIGEDVQDIISKINTKWEKADPFDGVFVMVRNTLPEVFASKGIDILLINENLIGQKQRVKGYLSNGKLKASFNVLLKNITLKETRKEIEKIAASKVHNFEGTLLEKINSKEFKNYMNILNERVNIMTFESMMETDFIEINE